VTHEVPVGIEPEGVAVSPDGATVVATSETSSMAHVIDRASATLKENLPVDARPRSAEFTRDGKRLWVSSELGGTVTVFETTTWQPVGKIDFTTVENAQPVGIAFSPDGAHAYVALGRGNSVAEIDAASLKMLRRFPVGERVWELAVSPDGARVYAANGLSGDLSIIDLKSGKVRSVQLGGRPWGVAVSR
jgi:YVTN family beta-propeller protein